MPSAGQAPGRRTTSEGLRAVRRAERLAERGNVPAAIEALQQALRLGADPFTCYIRLAHLHQTCRQWEAAVLAAESAVAENPDSVPAREAVMALYLEMRDYAGVIDAGKALIKLSPRNLSARDALGAAYVGLGNVDAALRVANDLVRLDPDNAAHHFTRAILFQHTGVVRRAVEGFERVLDLEPDTGLADSVREQLQSLDAFQLHQIITLALEDKVFRVRLLHNAPDAAAERGFHLSRTGLGQLQEIVQDMLDTDVTDSLMLYH